MVIFKSPFPPLALPEQDIFSFVFGSKTRPVPADHVMFQDGDTEKMYTYSGVQQRSRAFGAGLKNELDWQKGDILALFAANSIDVPAVMLGTLLVGGIFSPANPGYTVTELAGQLTDSQPKAIVTQYRLLATVKQALQKAGMPRLPVLLLGSERDPSSQTAHFTELRSSSSSSSSRPSTTAINPKTDIAFLVYSSGTTGKPKGVRLSHYNVTSNISQLQPGDQEYLTWDASKTCRDIPLPRAGRGGDKVLVCVPMYHILGLTKAIINPLYTGVTAVVMARFEIERWCALVQQHAITFSYIVPPMVLLLCKHPAVPSYDLSSIRMASSGAAPLSREVIDACHARTGIRIKQGYGMTETCPTVFNQTWDDWDRPVGSTGQLLPNVEAKLCAPVEEASESTADDDDSNQGLGLGEVGELYVRGPNVFLGYHNNPAATADCLSLTGWYRTGDVGYIDARGNLFITDRVKELIKYKGFSVAPAELEGYLLEHPLVDDCAVVGIQSVAMGTEVPTAYVVLTKASSSDSRSNTTQDLADGIQKWFNARVANHKKVRGGVKFVPAIPKSTSGKILRRVMKQWARAEEGKAQDGDAGSLRAKL
ncbi:hypothetical protein LTR96_011110 [Exophiala xenobiotica]|nr:hypothetical protein LTR41_011275 [Exophiala xenobiotica]KAK5215771.1 hypothetical protein LTR72_011185 [Exophiala xenobiotica]KAK5220884.1 hypothetical protein LTR47_011040 [Exophiala xenobiotica]KAK5245527.1 hypothetical protein LTS06_009049 [Exophiala xenobiotica]KAK5263476.1 hypothetical protein LTR96_011110 [Exophiala xenobiotica]